MTYDFRELEKERTEILNKTAKMKKLGYLIYPFFGFLQVKKAKQLEKNFELKIKPNVVRAIIKVNYPDATYEENNGVDLNTILNTDLYHSPDQFHISDLIKGSYKNVRFQCSDCEMLDIIHTRCNMPNGGSYYIDKENIFFSGRWYHYEFNRVFNGKLRVIEKSKTMDSKERLEGFKKMETESIAFNQKFDAYTDSEDYFFYMLTPLMIDKLLELEAIHNGSIRISFTNNSIDIAVNDRRDYLEPNISKQIDEVGYRDFISQIEIIGAIINELNLDGPKFTMEKGV